VDAEWVCYPSSGGVKLAPAERGARFELVRIEEVAERMFGEPQEVGR
jgi:hypothetical protein